MHKHKGKHGHKHRNGKIVQDTIVKIRCAEHFNGWHGVVSKLQDGGILGVDLWRDHKGSMLGRSFFYGFRRSELKRIKEL